MVQTTGEKVGKENGAGELMRREMVTTFKQAHAQEVGEIRVEKKGSLLAERWKWGIAAKAARPRK